MITLDQVLLLQEKVESAVAKITQLKAENDALRSKCAELTNALSAKTEQFSTFEADQSKIEHGVLQALERLNAVENAVVQAASQVAPTAVSAAPVATVAEPESEQPETFEEPGADFAEPEAPEYAQEAAPAFEQAPAEEAYTAPVQPYAAEPVAPAADPQAQPFPAEEAVADDSQQGQFDIF